MTRRMIAVAAFLLTTGAAHAVQELRPPSRSGIQTLQALPQAQPPVRAEPAPPASPKAQERKAQERKAPGTVTTTISMSGPVDDEELKKQFPNGLVAAGIHVALNQIGNARCGEKFCAPATVEEWEKLPVSIYAGRQAMSVGSVSFQSKWCGIGMEERVFLALMDTARRDWKFDDRQAAIIALLHGFIVGQLEAQREKAGPCPEALRTQLLTVKAGFESGRAR